MATIEHKGGNKWLLKVSDGVGVDGKRRRPTKTPGLFFLYPHYNLYAI